MTNPDALKRFRGKFDSSAGPESCWIWRGWQDQNGYGRVRLNSGTIAAHRFAYEVDAGSPVPRGMDVGHTCAVRGCVNPAHLRLIERAPANHEVTAEWFWSHADVRSENECWEWQRNLRRGYGQVWIAPKTRAAHRVAYELAKGAIPRGFQIDHLCRNTSCVNPAHLEAVTPQVNTLRSTAPSAANAHKTHCIRGHPLYGDNLFIRETQGGRRGCRECEREKCRRYRQRRKAREAAAREYDDSEHVGANGDVYDPDVEEHQ